MKEEKTISDKVRVWGFNVIEQLTDRAYTIKVSTAIVENEKGEKGLSFDAVLNDGIALRLPQILLLEPPAGWYSTIEAWGEYLNSYAEDHLNRFLWAELITTAEQIVHEAFLQTVWAIKYQLAKQEGIRRVVIKDRIVQEKKRYVETHSKQFREDLKSRIRLPDGRVFGEGKLTEHEFFMIGKAYQGLLPKAQGAVEIARCAQKSKDPNRRKNWQIEVKTSYSGLHDDLILRLDIAKNWPPEVSSMLNRLKANSSAEHIAYEWAARVTLRQDYEPNTTPPDTFKKGISRQEAKRKADNQYRKDYEELHKQQFSSWEERDKAVSLIGERYAQSKKRRQKSGGSIEKNRSPKP